MYGAWTGVSIEAADEQSRSTYSVGGEQTGCSWHCANMPTSLDDIDGVDVVRVRDTGTAKRTHELCEPVDRDLLVREVAEDGERECDRRVEVTT